MTVNLSMGDDCQGQELKRVGLAPDEAVVVVGPQEAAAGPPNLLSRDSHLKICISGIACRRAKRLLPTLTMKMVSFADADLADSKLILHRSKTNRRNSKLLALAKIMDKARCEFREGGVEQS